MLRPYAIALAGVFGLAAGSFANVLIWRIPRHESIVSPPSHCPVCNARLGWTENIPLFSWLRQRGRCHHCGAHISARYPIVEILTAGLFAVTAWRITPSSDLIAYVPLVFVLVVLSFIDIDHKLLPNRVVYPSIVVGAALFAIAALVGPGIGAWVRALLGGAAGFSALFILALIYPAGMGMGDVKLSGLLGMALAYQEWPRVFVGLLAGFFLGAIGGILLITVRRGGMKTQIPFGPYLAAGTILGVLWGGPIVSAWLRR